MEDDSDIRGPGSVFIYSSSLHTDTVDVVVIQHLILHYHKSAATRDTVKQPKDPEGPKSGETLRNYPTRPRIQDCVACYNVFGLVVRSMESPMYFLALHLILSDDSHGFCSFIIVRGKAIQSSSHQLWPPKIYYLATWLLLSGRCPHRISGQEDGGQNPIPAASVSHC